MKTLFIAVLFFNLFNLFAQDKTGIWQGTLDLQGTKLRIVFHVSESNGVFSSTLDSPDQHVKDIPVDTTVFENDFVKFVINSIQGKFEGIYNGEEISGTFSQMGYDFPLILKKVETIETIKRPQDPIPPFPYNEEEVKFRNEKAGITLAGTLTFPKDNNKFPAVVLISGSGPQNRDEEIAGHKPFLIIADFLSRNGIAVLRFDDRGVSHSEGDFSTADSYDFKDDALSAVNYLITRNEIDKNKIGLIGHSEGGMIAPLAAIENENVSFIILLAGIGVTGEEILIEQTEEILKAGGASDDYIQKIITLNKYFYSVVKEEPENQTAKEKLLNVFKFFKENLPEEETNSPIYDEKNFAGQFDVLTSKWFRNLLTFDPRPHLEKVTVPVLALFAEKDLQVTPKQNLHEVENALKRGGNKNYKVLELKGLNHLFQTANTGHLSEYGTIEETFSPTALEIILNWMDEIELRSKN